MSQALETYAIGDSEAHTPRCSTTRSWALNTMYDMASCSSSSCYLSALVPPSLVINSNSSMVKVHSNKHNSKTTHTFLHSPPPPSQTLHQSGQEDLGRAHSSGCVHLLPTCSAVTFQWHRCMRPLPSLAIALGAKSSCRPLTPTGVHYPH